MSLQEIGVAKCVITMKEGYIQDCFAVQTDSARILEFQVVEDGKYADLSGVDILLYVAEGDKAIYSTGDIVDAKNGRFRVELFNQQLLRPGKHKAQIEMTSSGKSISSPIFYINVEKSIKSGAEAGVNIALDFQEMKEIKKVVEQIELNVKKEHSDIKNTVQRGKDTAVHLSEIIKTSGTSQSKLVELIRSAGTTEEDIKKVVSEANLAKERLDDSQKKSAETVVKLENLNESGANTNLTLKNSIRDATSTKKALEELGVTIKKDVEVNKQDFDEKKSDFDRKYQGVLDIVNTEQARVEAEKLRATHDEKLQKLFEKGIEAELEGCIRPNLLNGTSNKWYEILIDDGVDKENKIYYFPGITLPINLLKKDTIYTGSYTIEFSDLDLLENASIRVLSPSNKTVWQHQVNYQIFKNKAPNGLHKIVSDIVINYDADKDTEFGPFGIRVDHIKSGKIRIKDLKLEEGSTATPWGPSVEDIANSINRKYIVTSILEYRLSTSNTALEGGDGKWMNYIQDVPDGLYLWQRMKNTYSDRSEDYTKPVCVKAGFNEKELAGTVAELKGIVKQLQEKIK